MQHSERRQRNKRSMMTAVHFYTIKQMVKSCHKRSALKAYKTQHISIQEQTLDIWFHVTIKIRFKISNQCFLEMCQITCWSFLTWLYHVFDSNQMAS